MIRSYVADGVLVIQIDGERSHLDGKALCSLIGQVRGKGKVEGVIGQQNVRVIVDNTGTDGSTHEAIDPK